MTYSFNMPLFFFISGLFAYKEELHIEQIRINTINKFLFLVVPAVAFSMFFEFCCDVDIFNFLQNGFGRYWFTITLFECFLLYYLIRLLVRSKFWQEVALLIFSLIGIIYLGLFSRYEIVQFDLNHLTKYFQFFAIGILAKMHYNSYIKLITNNNIISAVTLSFFILLAISVNCTMPSIVFHLLRDIVLRYLGTFVVISLFYRYKEVFNKDNYLTNAVSSIGRYSLPIYLLQYFFISETIFSKYDWASDQLTLNILCWVYTIVILALCVMFIVILSNSSVLKKYVLGIK